MRLSTNRTLVLSLILGFAFGCSPDDISRPTIDETVGQEQIAPATDPLVDPGPLSGDGLLPVPAGPARTASASSAVGPSAAPADGTFPLVLIHPRGERPGVRGAPVVDNFHDAVTQVQPGGTIRVFDGTYHVTEPVIIEKPVTIEPMSGATPVVVNGLVSGEVPDSRSFIAAGPSADVAIQGLTFENPEGHSSVSAEDGSEVLVRSSTLRVTNGVAGAFAWRGARMVMEESDFTGGQAGVFASNDDTELVVRNSTFRSHGVVAVQHQSGADGLVEGNDMVDCGRAGCARNFGGEVDVVGNRFSESRTDVNPFFHHIVLHSAGMGRVEDNVFDGCGHGDCVLAVRRADVAVVGNEFTVYEKHFTRFVVAGSDGTGGSEPNYAERAVSMLVADNVITGVGGSPESDPSNPDAYAIKEAAIMIENAGVSRVFRNEITNARAAFGAFGPCDACDPNLPEGTEGGVFAEGSDNVADLVMEGVRVFNESSATIRSSDFTRYHSAFVLDVMDPAASDLTCNWWGWALGPLNVSDRAVSIPWAVEPVAGTSTTACDGRPPETVRVEAGVTDVTTSPPTVPTVELGAYVVATTGTVLLADGSHDVLRLVVSRPMTFEAEGPGRPTVDPSGEEFAFFLRETSAAAGNIIFRGLRVLGGTITGIRASAPHHDLLVEDTEFHPTLDGFFSSGVETSGDGNVIVRNSSFHGGRIGVQFNGSASAEILDSHFDGQDLEAIRFGGATNVQAGRAEGNTIVNCGGPDMEACILTFGGPVEIVGNEITVDIARPASGVIVVNGQATVVDNIVEGTGGTNDPSDPTTWAITGGAISGGEDTDVVVSGNTIRNAYTGMNLHIGRFRGSDNVVDHAAVGIWVTNGGDVEIHSSDFTNILELHIAGDALGPGDLTCNWWGSTSGPTVEASVASDVYTPWATEPVAGTSTTTCTGGAVSTAGVSELCLSGSFEPKGSVKIGLSLDPDDTSSGNVVFGFENVLGLDPTVYTDAEIASGQPTADGVTVLVISRKATRSPVSDAYVQGVRDFIANGGSLLAEYDGAALVFSEHVGDNAVMANMTPSLELFTGTVDGGGALYPLEQSTTYVVDPDHPIMEGLPSHFLVGFRLAFADTGFNDEWLQAPATFVSTGGLDLVPPGTFPAVLAGRCGPSRVALFNLNYINVINQAPVDRMIANAVDWLVGGP